MNVARHHAEWMELVPHSGPFVSMTALMRVFPQGLDRRDPEAVRDLRRAIEEWQVDPRAPGKNRGWILQVLQNFLAWNPELLVEGQQIPSGLEAKMPEFGETLRPDLALVGPAGTPTAGKPHLLIQILPPGQGLEKPQADKHWKASPATRMAELLRATNTPLGLVTNGEEWTLVFALRGETTGYAQWYTTLWLEEHVTLSAFQSLFEQRRFFGVAENDTLLGMLRASLDDQAEVTTSLGNQVRDAVEVLIRAFDRIDQDSSGKLLNGVAEKSLYDAALTVMMRLVFLFSAEERGLLDLGKPLYDRNYAVSTLREQLQEVADQFGEEVLERRADGWARLLAIFRAVHGGIKHQDLPIPEYAGSLFDPDRYPFLEGRAQNTNWQNTVADPLPVNNRVVLHLLTSLQMLRMKIAGGGPTALRRLSFRGLDIEQIGHVYEGLLDYTAMRAGGPVIGLIGSKDITIPSVQLSDLESWRLQGIERLAEKLSEITKRTPATLKRAIESAELLDEHKLLIACHQDNALLVRVRPFASLIRSDSFGHPVVVLSKSVFLAKGTERRSTGTHYTPKSLTEPIVHHTLEPLVYSGLSEGLSKEEWKLRSPKDILNLKVCDMAMGSGAFLVQTCRYLAERLVESWEIAEAAHPGEVLITPEGEFSKGSAHERVIPNEPEERVALARRLIVDRCLYGVDINPMAVEMAKLSLWLITVQRDRPFTFLDHAVKCGDSLIGVSSVQQIENFSLRPGARQVTFATANLPQYIAAASAKRSALENLPSNDHTQVATKNRMHSEAETATATVRALADALIAFELHDFDGERYESEHDVAAGFAEQAMRKPLPDFQRFAREQLGERRPFHWPVEFPEVFIRGGFDAFVGNPPFLGGSKITGAISTEYREFLVRHIANGKKGNADLCAYFFLRAGALMGVGANAGLVATNTIAQGDTREVGLDELTTTRGMSIFRAVSSTKWPGEANLEVAYVWMRYGSWNGRWFLDDVEVDGITSYLDAAAAVNEKPKVLAKNLGQAFSGNKVYGEGFVLTIEAALDLISRDARNREVIFPYAKAEHINDRPDQTPGAWVINFGDRSLEEAKRFPDCYKIVLELVKPYRDQVNRAHTREKWWLHEHDRPDLYRAIGGLSRVLFHGFTCKYLCFSFLPTNIVFAAPHAVIALSGDDTFALLQSTIHEIWVRKYGSTLETRMRYPASDVFETFAFPTQMESLAAIGSRYYSARSSLMNSRGEGLTDTYNRFHKPSERAADTAGLRALHKEMDQAVAFAYGWSDLDLGHGFHETKQGERYTISESARRTVLDRLLALNHQRHAEEVAAGLHTKKAKSKKSGASAGEKSKKSKDSQAGPVLTQADLFNAAGDSENDH